MEGNFVPLAWRETHRINSDEFDDWAESERDYKETMKSAIYRRSNGINAFTDSTLDSTVESIELLKTHKCKCKGDLSPSAPAIIVDGERTNTHDDDRRQLYEYVHQISAADPLVDLIPFASDVDMKNGNVWGNVCITGIAESTMNALFVVEQRLRALKLSQTPHTTMESFCENAGIVVLIEQNGSLVLFGVYAQYGVTCSFNNLVDNVLQAYSFTVATATSSRSRTINDSSDTIIL